MVVNMITLIAALTALDILCTYIGVTRGFIYEANPIMAYMFGLSVPLTCIGAAVMVGLMLWFVSKHINRYAWVRPALMVVVVAKIAIVLTHVYWIAQVL